MSELDRWSYFHDKLNNKGIVVNTFMSGIKEDELQLNVFVVDTPDNNDWHNDMQEIQECSEDTTPHIETDEEYAKRVASIGNEENA